MPFTKAELLELMTQAKELGIKYIDVDGFKAEFEKPPKRIPAEVPEFKAEELVKEMSPFDGITDEEILYYSTPYYDELQAKKQAKEEAAQQTREVANG